MTPPQLHQDRPTKAKASKRTEHIYAILRFDDYLGPDTPIERRVTVKKVVADPDEADREVERLTGAQKEPGVRYQVQLTRIERRESDTPYAPRAVEFDGRVFHVGYGSSVHLVSETAWQVWLDLAFRARRGDEAAQQLLLAFGVRIADADGRAYWPAEGEPTCTRNRETT